GLQRLRPLVAVASTGARRVTGGTGTVNVFFVSFQCVTPFSPKRQMSPGTLEQNHMFNTSEIRVVAQFAVLVGRASSRAGSSVPSPNLKLNHYRNRGTPK